ncbi:MAG: polysaccharide biosynthesis tyrosine autokinase [Actinomycetota bacterium]|nr:MAG: polysaccharide biosynthesis tyrosine autokinase [Actinomycetota bacterium]
MTATEGTERERTLRDYWYEVLRRKWLVVAAVLAALLGAGVLVFLQDPIYRAEAQMLVRAMPSDTVFNNQTISAQSAERLLQTEIQVLESDLVRDRVREDLSLTVSPPRVRGRAVSGTDVVEVVVRSGDPETARVVADAYVQAYIDVRREQNVSSMLDASAEVQRKITELQGQIDQIDADIAAAGTEDISALEEQRRVLIDQQALFAQRLDQLQVDASLQTGSAQLVKRAELPKDPVEPQPWRTLAIAGFLGLLIGVAAALIVGLIDDSLDTSEELEEQTGLPVLAVVPVDTPPDNRPVAVSRPGDLAVESYRTLRTNVKFMGVDRPLRVLQVTSALPAEGKTTTASNLAVVLAQMGQSVLLIDADLRRPRLHEVFGVPRSPGLTNVLLGEPFEMVPNLIAEDLTLVTSGAVPPNPSELLSGARIAELLATVADKYDVVVLDSAPVLPVSDALALSATVDGVLVVTEAGRTTKKNVAGALEQLQRVEAPVIGLVLNRAVSSKREQRGYPYGYAYTASAGD